MPNRISGCSDSGNGGGTARPWQFVVAALTFAKRRIVARKARLQLDALPDHILKDLGISRCAADYWLSQKTTDKVESEG